MKVTIQFPDKIGEQVLGLPDRDLFVSEVVAGALKHRSTEEVKPISGSSKWAEIVCRVRQDPDQLGDYYPRFKKDMREFRESFHFKHDGTE